VKKVKNVLKLIFFWRSRKNENGRGGGCQTGPCQRFFICNYTLIVYGTTFL
jgi:hypothetical protein